MQFLLVASLAVQAQSHTLKTVVTKRQPVVKKQKRKIVAKKRKLAAITKMIAVKMIIKKQIILQIAATNNSY